MSSNTDDTIPIEILTGYWSDLKEHAARDAVFVVSGDLELATVALKVATDDAAAVGAWIQEAKLMRPTLEQINAWSRIDKKAFAFVILQPHILIQERGH